MDGENDPGVAGELAEALGPRVVHPEPALEVDLAGRVAAPFQKLDGLGGALARGHSGRADAYDTHVAEAICKR
jgi:hypothetical protein